MSLSIGPGAFHLPPSPQQVQSDVSRFLKEFDADKSGSLSLEEAKKSGLPDEAIFHALDADGSSDVNKEELTKLFTEGVAVEGPPAGLGQSAGGADGISNVTAFLQELIENADGDVKREAQSILDSLLGADNGINSKTGLFFDQMV